MALHSGQVILKLIWIIVTYTAFPLARHLEFYSISYIIAKAYKEPSSCLVSWLCTINCDRYTTTRVTSDSATLRDNIFSWKLLLSAMLYINLCIALQFHKTLLRLKTNESVPNINGQKSTSSHALQLISRIQVWLIIDSVLIAITNFCKPILRKKLI